MHILLVLEWSVFQFSSLYFKTVHFYETGGAGGIWGGGTRKKWVERGGQPKKNKGKGGGSDEKIR